MVLLSWRNKLIEFESISIQFIAEYSDHMFEALERQPNAAGNH